MLFKLPLLIIVETNVFFSKAYSHGTPIHRTIQAEPLWLDQIPTEVGGSGAHLLSILPRTPEKHQGPRNKLDKALLQKDPTIF